MARKDSPLTCGPVGRWTRIAARTPHEEIAKGEGRRDILEDRLRSAAIPLSGESSRRDGIYAFRRRLKTLMYTASYNVCYRGRRHNGSRPANDVVRLRRRGLSVIIYRPIPEWP